MTHRIIIDILLLLSIVLLPFWVAVVLALVLLFYFKNYWEIIPIFFIIDFLYAAPEHRFAGILIVSLLGATVAYFLIQLLKRRLIIIGR